MSESVCLSLCMKLSLHQGLQAARYQHHTVTNRDTLSSQITGNAPAHAYTYAQARLCKHTQARTTLTRKHTHTHIRSCTPVCMSSENVSRAQAARAPQGRCRAAMGWATSLLTDTHADTRMHQRTERRGTHTHTHTHAQTTDTHRHTQSARWRQIFSKEVQECQCVYARERARAPERER